jgi:hypothetical protein
LAARDCGTTTLAGGASTDWFIHGYGDNDAVVYSIVVVPLGEPPSFLGHATLTQGEFFRHVDGTYAQQVTIQNDMPNDLCWVHLIAIVETLV